MWFYGRIWIKLLNYSQVPDEIYTITTYVTLVNSLNLSRAEFSNALSTSKWASIWQENSGFEFHITSFWPRDHQQVTPVFREIMRWD